MSGIYVIGCTLYFRLKKYKIDRAIVHNPESAFMTLVHCDYWTTNMMFRDAEDGSGKPEKMKLFDFATVCLGHPAYDIVFFLYVSTDKKFRQEVFDRPLILWKPYVTCQVNCSISRHF